MLKTLFIGYLIIFNPETNINIFCTAKLATPEQLKQVALNIPTGVDRAWYELHWEDENGQYHTDNQVSIISENQPIQYGATQIHLREETTAQFLISFSIHSITDMQYIEIGNLKFMFTKKLIQVRYPNAIALRYQIQGFEIEGNDPRVNYVFAIDYDHARQQVKATIIKRDRRNGLSESREPFILSKFPWTNGVLQKVSRSRGFIVHYFFGYYVHTFLQSKRRRLGASKRITASKEIPELSRRRQAYYDLGLHEIYHNFQN